MGWRTPRSPDKDVEEDAREPAPRNDRSWVSEEQICTNGVAKNNTRSRLLFSLEVNSDASSVFHTAYVCTTLREWCTLNISIIEDLNKLFEKFFLSRLRINY